MNPTLSLADLEVIKQEVSKQHQQLSDSEFNRALGAALVDYTGGNTKLTVAISAEIETWRAKFTPGFTVIGGRIAGSTAFWQKVYRDAEDAAKRELLAGSRELAELDALQAEATAAKQKADAKNAQLNAVFAEFNGIPDKAARLQHQLTNCGLERELLSEVKLAAQIKSNYLEWLQTGNQNRKIDADFFCAVLTQRAIKVSVIDELETQLRSELKTLDKRNVELARTLNIKRYQLS